TVTKNRTLTANFTYSLTTNVVGSGSVTRNPNASVYSPGTVVTLTAVASTGYHFTGWSGDTTTATNPISIAMNANRSFTATFAINTYTITLNTIGNGTAAANPNQATYNYGTPVTLTATPQAGNAFVSWSGVTATFALNTYTITLSSNGNGSAAASPSQATYNFGTPVTLTATPNAGNAFVSWSGDTTTTTNPLSIVVTKNRTLTANFTYTLTTSVSGGGSVGVSPNQTAFVSGSSATLTATPSTGWHFTSWSGDTTAATNPLTLNI